MKDEERVLRAVRKFERAKTLYSINDLCEATGLPHNKVYPAWVKIVVKRVKD